MILNNSASRLIIKGYKRALVRDDLWSLNAEDTSSAVKERYEKHWQAQVNKIKRLVLRFWTSLLPNIVITYLMWRGRYCVLCLWICVCVCVCVCVCEQSVDPYFYGCFTHSSNCLQLCMFHLILPFPFLFHAS